MKAYEAISILEELDPSTEVTLTIGKAAKIKPPDLNPRWQHPFHAPILISPTVPVPAWTITCETKQ